jgi:hypothetical protein
VVAELYSGIGLVGLNVASRAKEVFCSDSNEYVDGVFDKCADSLPQVRLLLLLLLHASPLQDVCSEG